MAVEWSFVSVEGAAVPGECPIDAPEAVIEVEQLPPEVREVIVDEQERSQVGQVTTSADFPAQEGVDADANAPKPRPVPVVAPVHRDSQLGGEMEPPATE
jgi:hypothetical protein